ncbi:MAG: phosphohistidine phosphatase SixA [Candidatus Brocadiaceae bacterium]|nr:phosphohistidine phosphatase SixA [Candidatus Brocadiaceae bacterium]
MEIYLVRHGSAYTKEEDPERHLNDDGLSECHLTGKALKRLDIMFDIIVSSPKVRARQTAEIIAEEVGYSRKEIKTTETLQPTTDPNDTISFLNDLADTRSVLLAGHLPLLGNLVSALLNKSSTFSFYFETGTVCLINAQQPIPHASDFQWFLAPENIELLARI